MKKKNVVIGSVYAVKVSGNVVPVRVVRESPYGGWEGLNLKTRRSVRIRTAARLRHPWQTRHEVASLTGPVTETTVHGTAPLLQRQPWTLWTGRRARNRENGELFIETFPGCWEHRMRIWKAALLICRRQNVQPCPCPCPMPEGHIMFDGALSTYQPYTVKE